MDSRDAIGVKTDRSMKMVKERLMVARRLTGAIDESMELSRGVVLSKRLVMIEERFDGTDPVRQLRKRSSIND